MKEKLIFLDIDGVLNSEMYSHKCLIEHLYTNKPNKSHLVDEHAVQLVLDIVKATNAKIIISSSWRCWTYKDTIEDLHNFEDLRPLLPYIYGVTPKTDNRIRGEEIKYFCNMIRKRNFNYCFKEPISNNYNYVIIDDDVDMLEEQLPYFIQTRFMVGLTKENVKDAINILNKDI